MYIVWRSQFLWKDKNKIAKWKLHSCQLNMFNICAGSPSSASQVFDCIELELSLKILPRHTLESVRNQQNATKSLSQRS